jgi:hypothetical protein
MRKSINDHDNMDWEVYLNGQEEPLCVYADEEAGFILTYVLDCENRIRGDAEGPYCRIKRGKIELRRVNAQADSMESTLVKRILKKLFLKFNKRKARHFWRRWKFVQMLTQK